MNGLVGCDLLLQGAHIARIGGLNNYDIVKNAALAISGNKIVWLGKQVDLPDDVKNSAKVVRDISGCWLTPGLIDCHTHLVYAGQRADEFAKRLQSLSYEQIAQAGGGIQCTVAATRALDEDLLYEVSAKRLQAMISQGLTTVEIKSGYGLDLATELKMLRVAKKLQENFPVTVQTTFLGAHVMPKEFERADDYIDFVCREVLPQAHEAGLVDAVDVFCERMAFSTAQAERVFKAASALGLPVKMHAEQLSNSGGAHIAARYQALSVDHLEYLDEAAVIAMAAAGTVAVLLPAAAYFLKETRYPPIDLLRQHGVPMAVATDCNPGSAPVTSLPLVMNMACVLFGLTPCEALAGATYCAAKALGMDADRGSLAVGKHADIAIWDIEYPDELAYYMGSHSLVGVIQDGLIASLDSSCSQRS